ncbi:unnamed protein product [Paramecium pentaurelia]|uniref:mitogen-activated protein kinase n=1 Tax=Paramecium pentaurelia TaxID=43138 RepID=A0A8S1X4U3_9CILI|nr:unnamed protein product [Paramecium pentaurelia]
MQPQSKSSQKEDEHCQVEDHIQRKFELLEFKGKGAYGVVWKAVDRKTKQIVALKKIFDAFHNATDSQRTFREVVFLEQLVNHENIIKLTCVIKAENNKDLYMVFDFMETDLHKVIRANILEPIHKKYIIYQILKGLKYLHTGELIHRDLKPSNLLINSECKVKVADFGLARSVAKPDDNSNPILTEYVATRWYRAPEILLGSQHYSKAVDMWSLGCILGEMIIGKAIFPGTSTLNQIERIIELIGRPKQDELDAIKAPLADQVISNISTQKRKSITQLFASGEDEAIDFIRQTLIYNPYKRMTVEQALNHPYVKEFKGTEDEISRDSAIETFMDDNHKFTVKEYRDALYSHITQKKKMEHQILIRNLKNVPVNISAEKSTSPTKKDSFLKKSKDSEPSNTDISDNKQYESQNVNRPFHHKTPSYTQQLRKKTTSQEHTYNNEPTNQFIYQSPNMMMQKKQSQSIFPNVDSGSPLKQIPRKQSMQNIQNSVSTVLQNTLSQNLQSQSALQVSQHQLSRKGSQGSIQKSSSYKMSATNYNSTNYNSAFQQLSKIRK